MKWPVVVISVVGLMALLGAVKGVAGREGPNERVVGTVQRLHADDPWMDHVTDWGTRLSLTVKTDYPHDDVRSYVAAYEICRAVTDAYAPNANDLPSLRIYGQDTTTNVKIDGSVDDDVNLAVLAQSTSMDDYRCTISPREEMVKKTKELELPVARR